MDEILYLQTDDTLNIGVEPIKHTKQEGQELHDFNVKNKNQVLQQFKKHY